MAPPISSDGITSVQVMPLVKYGRIPYALRGVFVLAGQAGSGDTGDVPEPQGAIALAADPPGPVMLGLLREITVTGGPITDAGGNLVPDHTPVTVAGSLE
jgi:hypothetical protein